MFLRTIAFVLLSASLLPLFGQPLAPSARSRDLAAGRILVATNKSRDPGFARTVILLVHYDVQGAIGLTLNRRLDVPLSRVFPDMKEAKELSAPVWAGGPLSTGVMVLYRSRTRPENASPVCPGVYLITDKSALAKLLAASGARPSVLRVYAGYAGWSQQQIKNEVDLGLWYIFGGEAGVVFDPKPESLWSRLIQQTSRKTAATAPRRLLH